MQLPPTSTPAVGVVTVWSEACLGSHLIIKNNKKILKNRENIKKQENISQPRTGEARPPHKATHGDKKVNQVAMGNLKVIINRCYEKANQTAENAMLAGLWESRKNQRPRLPHKHGSFGSFSFSLACSEGLA